MSELKRMAAKAAMEFIEPDSMIGIGTGSTVNFFIQELASQKANIDACVCSSKASAALVRSQGIPVVDLNAATEIFVYIDSADEVTAEGMMIKGGGGALTGEKIVAQASKKFICIVDESKLVSHLGAFPVAVEVLPMARSLVGRQLVQLGGDPEYREGFVTDNGNIILDVFNMDFTNPGLLEEKINSIPGVVDNGIFAHRQADILLVASNQGVKRIK